MLILCSRRRGSFFFVSLLWDSCGEGSLARVDGCLLAVSDSLCRLRSCFNDI